MNRTLWLEITINRLLRLDPYHGELLSSLDNKRFVVELLPTQRRLLLVIQNGSVQISAATEQQNTADLLIRGLPHQLLGLLRTKPTSIDELTRTGVKIEGDYQLAQRVAEIANQLQPDWEEALAALVGDEIAHRAGVTAREFSSYGKRLRRSVTETLGDFFKYELDLAAGREEVTQLYSEIDQLKAEIEKLKQDRQPTST